MTTPPAAPTDERLQRLELLYRVGLLLLSERDTDRLIETLMLEAKALCGAEGGTLYLRTDDDHLAFAMVRNDRLGIALGGTTGRAPDLPPLPLRDPATGAPNEENVATAAALRRRSFNVPDAYAAQGFDFSGAKAFDRTRGYRSRSILTIPLVNKEQEVIGVLQLINARSAEGEVVPFSEANQEIVEAVAAQAALILDQRLLARQQTELLHAVIRTLASAIDAKSPYTGGHCERVPVLTELLTAAACRQTEGPFAAFDLSAQEWEELRIAAWLHDCGKITTPVHVMDKATKLEKIHDRMESVRLRFEVLRRDAELELARGELDPDGLRDRLRSLDEELAFLESANRGGEFLRPADQERIRALGARTFVQRGRERPLLEPDEVANLCISRGTLNDEERRIINGHMVHTIAMLESLPFPRHLRRVPEYAGGHHEKLDGTGYPRGVFAGDLPIPARAMAIADVFEALTAQDRPYKPGKKLSEALRIMAAMKRDHHLDPDLLDLFVSSKVYLEYARRYLPPELIDEVDEAEVLAARPKPLELPPPEERARRRTQLLAEYLPLLRPTVMPPVSRKPGAVKGS